MTNKHPFYQFNGTTKNQALEAAIHLTMQDYEELPVAGSENDATHLFIDANAKVFWFCSPSAIKATTRIIRLNNKTEVTKVDLEGIENHFVTPAF